MPDQNAAEATTLDAPQGKHEAQTLSLTGSASPQTVPGNVPGYDILAESGSGGMGVVYKAHHRSLNRVVALKMILSGSHAGPMELVRFRQEAETVARLQHPNVVQIHEVGAHAGHSYLALEYVEGGSLAQKTAGLPQPPGSAPPPTSTG
jgi:serine/threonine protein kinase